MATFSQFSCQLLSNLAFGFAAAQTWCLHKVVVVGKEDCVGADEWQAEMPQLAPLFIHPHPSRSPVVCQCTGTKADKMFLNMLQNIFPLISVGVKKIIFPMGNVAFQIKHFGRFTMLCYQ